MLGTCLDVKFSIQNGCQTFASMEFKASFIGARSKQYFTGNGRYLLYYRYLSNRRAYAGVGLKKWVELKKTVDFSLMSSREKNINCHYPTAVQQWYLKHRLRVSTIYQLVEYMPSRCFLEFLKEVTEVDLR